MIVAQHLSITGRVQGVGFRAFVTRQARSRHLRGWVRNRSDGTVEALLIGESAAVAAVVVDCERGPAMARVDRVEQSSAQDDGTADFGERATV
jgi:acylphosphatase